MIMTATSPASCSTEVIVVVEEMLGLRIMIELAMNVYIIRSL
jgi:hypothetical protein